MWAPSLSSLTEVKEETRRDKEERKRRQMGAMTENREPCIIMTALHAFVGELNTNIVHR